MRGELFSEFDGSSLFGYLFIPLFCGRRTPKEGKKKHMSTFQIYACNYLNSFTQIVNMDSEITQRILELQENLHVFRQKIILAKCVNDELTLVQNKVVRGMLRKGNI